MSKKRGGQFKCPSCGSKVIIRTSNDLDKTVREARGTCSECFRQSIFRIECIGQPRTDESKIKRFREPKAA